MPVFRSGKGSAPNWCEMEYFEIIRLSEGEKHKFGRIGRKEKLILGEGKCQIALGGKELEVETGTNLDLEEPDGCFEVLNVLSDSTLIRMCGRWGEETGGAGLFAVVKNGNPRGRGDSVDYPKEIGFDNHYHDCDEYWILFEGSGLAASEGKLYEVSPGDCIATGMGHHHDFPKVFESVKAVYFETTMEGEKRRGHLWNHTHGQADPMKERT